MVDNSDKSQGNQSGNLSATNQRDNSRESHNEALSSLLMLAQANDPPKNDPVSFKNVLRS